MPTPPPPLQALGDMFEKMAKEELAKANAQEGRAPDPKVQQQEKVTRDMQQKMYDNKIQRQW